MRFAPLLPWLVVAGAALTVPAISCAAASDWQDLGLRASQAPGNLTVDPSHPKVVYGFDDRGLVRSTNQGRSFARVPRAPAGARMLIQGYGANRGVFVVVEANDGLELWRIRSVGRRFQRLGLLPELFDLANGQIAADTRRRGVFYVSDGDVEAGLVYRTSDAGRHWRPILGGAASLAVDPAQPGRVYAYGLLEDESVLASDDVGRHWHGRSRGITGTPDEAPLVLDIAADARKPGRLVATTLDGPVFFTRDGGRHWHRARARGVGGGFGVLASARGVTLFSGPRGLFRSVDGGRTWSRVPGTYPAAPDGEEVDVAPLPGGGFAVSSTFEGYFRTNAGATRVVPSAGRPGSPYATAVLPIPVAEPAGDTVLAGTFGRGVLLRPAAHTTWTAARGLPPFARIGSLARSATAVYAAGVDGVFVSGDGGASFRPVLRQPIASMVAEGDDVWAGGAAGLYRSIGGGPFTRVTAGLPATLAVRAVGVLGADVAVEAAQGFYLSTGGAFARRSAGAVVESDDGIVPSGRISVVFDPRSSATIFRGLQRSVDGGRTWAAPTGMFDQGLIVVAAVTLIDPSQPDRHYATSEFVLRSEDGGRTFPLSLDGPTPPYDVALDGAGGLLTATWDGVFRLPDPAAVTPLRDPWPVPGGDGIWAPADPATAQPLRSTSRSAAISSPPRPSATACAARSRTRRGRASLTPLSPAAATMCSIAARWTSSVAWSPR